MVIQVMDTNNNGSVDYTEFIAGCMQSYVYLKENNLKHAFEYFDKDGNGTITLEELKESL
jgi:calcium-dependent protein kinase